jgi:RNA polymerase sigma-70 factor (ECF subfamily)
MHVVDHELLMRLVDGHGPALVLYAQQWCDGPEDVVQEALLRLMRARPAPDNPVGWLYRVVRNRAISESRSRAVRGRHQKHLATTRQPWFEPNADAALDGAEATAALESLPVDLREVVVLRVWSGLSFDEIGQLVGKSTSTAHRKYEAGLTALRNKWSMSCPNETAED